MERCKTARCAVQLMGDLAVEYGFYGAVWKGDPFTVEGEAGEAMTVTDKTESWMFHIIGDDTGKSAVWLAQRVPEGHVTVVANGFVIKEVRKGQKPKQHGDDNDDDDDDDDNAVHLARHIRRYLCDSNPPTLRPPLRLSSLVALASLVASFLAHRSSTSPTRTTSSDPTTSTR